jgi:hypothetical protein
MQHTHLHLTISISQSQSGRKCENVHVQYVQSSLSENSLAETLERTTKAWQLLFASRFFQRIPTEFESRFPIPRVLPRVVHQLVQIFQVFGCHEKKVVIRYK